MRRNLAIGARIGEGPKSICGRPLVGTLVFFALRFFPVDYGACYPITLGTIAIIVMLLAPRLWGLIGDGLNIHLFPVQRHVRLGAESKKSFGLVT